MLADLPPGVIWIGLGCMGAILGAAINAAIYRWTIFLRRPISPWLRPAEDESPRRWLDYLPILGWPGRRRDSAVYGRGFWIRPLILEVIWAGFVPWFYFWLAGGGLFDLNAPVPASQVETWFGLYLVFFGLMCIGTFIDFDEQMIPDQVTVTGTVIALLVAAGAPWARLPETVSKLGGTEILPIHFASPGELGQFHIGTGGLVIGLLIWWIWIWALLPKLPVWYVGWGTSIRFMFAHAFRPRRKTNCDLRVRRRRMPRLTLVLMGLLVIGSAGIAGAWKMLPESGWSSLYGSLLGLAFGGGLIWSIRIIGTVALQKEAMGFGDVTLMAMIGATLGWQATLLAFVLTMVTVVLGLIVQVLITRGNPLAFGPYLCAGGVLLVFRWHAMWPPARQGVFQLGPILIYILLGSLVLMAVMLLGLQWLKGLLLGPEEESG